MIEKPAQLDYNPDNQIGMDKIKKHLSCNLFKPLMNKELLSSPDAYPKTFLMHGPHDTGKNTMVYYVVHQLQWNLLTFDWINMIGCDPINVKNIIMDAYNYCFNKNQVVFYVKNIEAIIDIDESVMKSYKLKLSILQAFKDLLLKFNTTEGKNIITVFVLNKTDEYVLENTLNLLDVFEVVLKFNYLSIDETAVFILTQLRGHSHELTWDELLKFAFRLRGMTWPKLNRIISIALRKESQFITEDNVFEATEKSILSPLTIKQFKEALKEEASNMF